MEKPIASNRRRYSRLHSGLVLSLLVLVMIFSVNVSLWAQATLQSKSRQTIENQISVYLEEAVTAMNLPGDLGGISVLVRVPSGDFFASTVSGAKPEWHFRAASVTKTTTAAAIMLLEQRGLVRLDDKVTSLMPGRNIPYLPDTPDYAVPHKEAITIRQLLQHRAGVFDVGNDPVPAEATHLYAGRNYIDWMNEQDPEHSFSIDELVAVAANCQLSYGPPPAKYHYSNTGYSMLGKIIERASGKALHEFLYAEFIRPLGLSSTYLVVSGKDRMPWSPYLPGYSSAEGQVLETTEDNASYAHAEGNMVSTFSELATWIRALMRGEAGVTPVNAARMREVLPTNPEGTSGYGLGISENPKGLGYGHDGGIMGYYTVARHHPESDFTIIMVCSHLKFDDMYGMQKACYGAAMKIKALFE